MEIFKPLNRKEARKVCNLPSGKKIILLDWEFSRYDFPEWDLVYFMQSLRLNPKQKELFLKTYGYPTSKTGKKRLGKRIYQVIKLVEDDIGSPVMPYFEPLRGPWGRIIFLLIVKLASFTTNLPNLSLSIR